MVAPETWRPVVGFEGAYSVSDRGRVRNEVTGKVLKGRNNLYGHYTVQLRGRTKMVHRLVAESFIGPAPEGKPLVLHWDDDKNNNRVSNLRWGTQSDNIQDSVRNGSHSKASRKECPNGHPFAGENVTLIGSTRRCLTCHRERARRYREAAQNRGLPPGDSRHGTLHGRQWFKCNCSPCVEAGEERWRNGSTPS